MSSTHSKTTFLHGKVRRALQSGQYAPGHRIDVVAIAAQFNISTTPARLVKYRLIGEGLIADDARNGTRVPLPNELALWDLYDWMQCLLHMTCRLIKPTPTIPSDLPIAATAEDDLVKLTWKLFDAIGRDAGSQPLHQELKRTNDRLAPIRRATQDSFSDDVEELSQLLWHWHQRDLPSLESALDDYHVRRKQLVPSVVSSLMMNTERSH